MRLRTLAFSCLAVAAPLAAISTNTTSADATRPFARARLFDASGHRVGTVAFVDDSQSPNTIVFISLRPGSGVSASRYHGIHIHANDVATNGEGCVADGSAASNTWFVSADGHWKHDPTELHGNHAGDLPSPFVNADGSARLRTIVDKIGPDEVVGRAVILHAGPDNFGNVPVGPALDQYTANAVDATTKTQATGNAGDRVACGVVTHA
jgi:superoxide dismutase, Cu-Zn family